MNQRFSLFGIIDFSLEKEPTEWTHNSNSKVTFLFFFYLMSNETFVVNSV